jgi:hypothetical protein
MRRVLAASAVILGLAGCPPRQIELVGVDCANHVGAWFELARAELDVKYPLDWPDVQTDAEEIRISHAEVAFVKHCIDDNWSPAVLACRPNKACSDDLTATQRARIATDLRALIPALVHVATGETCAAVFDDHVLRAPRGTPMNRLLYLQIVAPTTREMIISHCEADHWSSIAIHCFVLAGDEPAWNACASNLTAPQHEAVDRDLGGARQLARANPSYPLFHP